jgi:predicted phosphodiesterase
VSGGPAHLADFSFPGDNHLCVVIASLTEEIAVTRSLLRKAVPGAVVLVALAALLPTQRPGPSGGAVPQQPAAPAPQEFAHFVIAPYLQYATRDSITILWETSHPGTSVVKYGVGGLAQKKEGAAGVTLHEVTLTDLKPNTPYVYQVSSSGAGLALTSPLLTFATAVGPEDAFSFAVFGDTQKNPRITGKIARLAWERRPNFVVHVGDVVDNGPDKREWVNELFGPCAELFARVPVYPCIGNHEKNHAFYYRYFALPAPEYHYRYRYGNADFFSIDTNKPVGPGTEQYRWLDAELGKSDAKWKFVYHHHPAYSSDNDDYGDTFKGKPSSQGDKNARKLVELYEKHDVDIVFNGHIHVYERTWPLRVGKVDHKKGVRYITSGGGGGALENFSPVPTWFKAQCRSDYHFCYVTIHAGRLEFKAFDHQGMLFDTFDLDKK